MCKYCEVEKPLGEKEDNIKVDILGKHLRIYGKVFSIPIGRDFIISYCPMCGRRLGDD